MDRNELLSLIRGEIQADKQAAQYGVTRVPVHTHNGLDSLQIHFEDLGNAQQIAKVARVTLTPTQVKALNTTPITLVPAPMPSKTAANARTLIIVEGIEGYLAYGGTAYTGANALEFRYTDASGAKVTADISTTFLNASASAYSHVAGVVTELVPVSNAPIVVRVPTADPATGNSPITFQVKYRVVSF